MSSARDRIRRRAKALELPTILDMTWTPIRMGGEKSGLDGGWDVYFADGRFAVGLNVGELLDDLDRLALRKNER